jgi:membrane peptidoglycan carboxypeptidase
MNVVRQPIRALRALVLLVVASVVAGTVLAGILMPVIGGVGAGAKSAADAFESLPTELRMPQLSQRTQILAADGTPLATFFYENRVVVPLSKVPKVARNAIIAIEDSRFYTDNGIDLKGILRAAVTNAGSGDVRQGGSTLTQQLVKNVLVQSATTKKQQEAATSDTISRKIREARYAIALANTMSKREILERYLNIVYFGEGAYGIATAAKHYFGQPVGKLTLAQAALLAGMVRNPAGYDPVANPADAKARRDTVLARMAELGYITKARARYAMSRPLGVHISRTGNGCESSWAPFFCDYIIRELLSDKHLGATEDDRRKLLLTGGLKIYTTLQPKTQRSAQHAVDSTVPPKNRNNGGPGIAASAVSVQPGTGAVVAMAVDRKYSHQRKHGATSVNYALGGSTGYQPGSTMKAFVLADALRQGIPLTTRFNCPHDYVTKAFPNDRPYPYPVHNAGDSEAGRFDLIQATWLSVNTCFVQLEAKTGAVGPARLAGAMGVHAFPDKPLGAYASFFLGTNAVSPLDMAGAYATFADEGTYCTPHGIQKIVSGNDVLENAKPSCRRVLSQDVADTVTSVLRGVIDGPDPFRTGARASIGRPAAGKTGTTNDEATAWFCGYTPQLATVVWVGDPRGPTHPLHGINADGQYWPVVFGGDLPAIIWNKTMRGALAGVPARDFPLPLALPPPPPKPKPKPKPSASTTPSPTPSQPPNPKPSPPPTPKPKPSKSKPPHH